MYFFLSDLRKFENSIVPFHLSEQQCVCLKNKDFLFHDHGTFIDSRNRTVTPY